jgi:hypothetical protein
MVRYDNKNTTDTTGLSGLSYTLQPKSIDGLKPTLKDKVHNLQKELQSRGWFLNGQPDGKWEGYVSVDLGINTFGEAVGLISWNKKSGLEQYNFEILMVEIIKEHKLKEVHVKLDDDQPYIFSWNTDSEKDVLYGKLRKLLRLIRFINTKGNFVELVNEDKEEDPNALEVVELEGLRWFNEFGSTEGHIIKLYDYGSKVTLFVDDIVEVEDVKTLDYVNKFYGDKKNSFEIKLPNEGYTFHWDNFKLDEDIKFDVANEMYKKAYPIREFLAWGVISPYNNDDFSYKATSFSLGENDLK